MTSFAIIGNEITQEFSMTGFAIIGSWITQAIALTIFVIFYLKDFEKYDSQHETDFVNWFLIMEIATVVITTLGLTVVSFIIK